MTQRLDYNDPKTTALFAPYSIGSIILYNAIFPSTQPDILLCSYAPPFSLFVPPNIYIFTRFCDIQQSCCKGSLNGVHYSLSYNVTTSLLTILPLLRALPHVFIQIDYRFQNNSGFCERETLKYGL